VFSTQFRFLLAKLQMEHILSPRSPKAQLEGFKTVPKGLYSAYNGVIERIESGRQGDADCAMRIFSWIYHARRILKMDELLEALVIAEYSQDIMSGEPLDEDLEAILEDRLTPGDIVETCKGLVLYDESSGSVRFSHETVKEFIEKELKQRLPPPITLAKTCLIYLGSNAFDTCCSDDEALGERVTTYKFSGYASQYWADYIRGDPKGEEETQDTIFGTFRSVGKRKSIAQMQIYTERTGWKLKLSTGRSLLHVIAANGLAATCKRLLDGTFNDNGGYIQKLFLQLIESSQEIEQTSIEATDDSDGATALSMAARQGYVDVVKVLLNANANIEAVDKHWGQTPLSWAAKNGHMEAVKLLLNANANIEAVDKWEETPLSWAAENGHVDVVKLLLNANAKIEVMDEWGRTPLSRAAENRHMDVVKLLLNANAKIEAVDDRDKRHLVGQQRMGT
jgi:hypothetical protein